MGICECDIKDNILHFKNIISQEDCKYLIKTIDDHKKYGKNVDHSIGNNIKSHVIDMSCIEDSNIVSDCSEIINKTVKNILLTLPESLRCLKSACYVHNVELRKIWGETLAHVDGAINDPNDPGSIKHVRVLSIIVALNSDYDGGELCFPEQDFKIKLKVGEALAFPPYWTHPHYSNELKNDTYRYTITTWFCE